MCAHRVDPKLPSHSSLLILYYYWPKFCVLQFEIKRHVESNSQFLQHLKDYPQTTVSISIPLTPSNLKNVRITLETVQ